VKKFAALNGLKRPDLYGEGKNVKYKLMGDFFYDLRNKISSISCYRSCYKRLYQ